MAVVSGTGVVVVAPGHTLGNKAKGLVEGGGQALRLLLQGAHEQVHGADDFAATAQVVLVVCAGCVLG